MIARSYQCKCGVLLCTSLQCFLGISVDTWLVDRTENDLGATFCLMAQKDYLWSLQTKTLAQLERKISSTGCFNAPYTQSIF